MPRAAANAGTDAPLDGASPDPAVDAAIRKQFADVRGLLGKFLDSRPITDLQYHSQVKVVAGRPPKTRSP